MNMGLAVALGVAVGSAIFAGTDDAWWIGVGAGVGAAFGAAFQKKGSRQ